MTEACREWCCVSNKESLSASVSVLWAHLLFAVGSAGQPLQPFFSFLFFKTREMLRLSQMLHVLADISAVTDYVVVMVLCLL